jgi:hypothetical protein
VLLSGDATGDAGEVGEGFETLIAVGTQAGKVLVYNILGLLIHEIDLGISVTAVEWVGDMTAPPALPARASSLSPKPCPVVETVGTERSISSDEEEMGTVKKVTFSHKQAMTRKPIPMRPLPDLFSDEPQRLKSRVPSRRTSDILRGSPLRVERARERPGKKSLTRPRISTETFDSPPGPSSNDFFHAKSAHTFTKADPPIQESRRWPQIHQAPDLPSPSRAQHFSASHRASSSSPESQYSDEDQEWFTPPSTKKCKEKVPRRRLNSDSSPTASANTVTCPMPFPRISPAVLDTPSILYSRPTSRMMEKTSATQQRAIHERSKVSVNAPKATQRHVTILDPELSSPFDSPSSLYSRPTPQMFDKPPMVKAHEANTDQQTALLTEPKPPVLKLARTNIDAKPEPPNSTCSRSTPVALKDTDFARSDNNAASPNELSTRPLTPQTQPIAISAPNSPSSFCSSCFSTFRPKAETALVQNYSPRSPAIAPQLLTPNSLDTRGDSPSSVYSRSISGMPKDAIHANARIEDTDQFASSIAPDTPQHQLSIHALGTPLSTSSPSSLYPRPTPRMFLHRSHAVDGPSVEKRKDGELDPSAGEVRTVAEEMICLAEDQRALRQEVAALRDEYRVLKGVLLKPNV